MTKKTGFYFVLNDLVIVIIHTVILAKYFLFMKKVLQKPLKFANRVDPVEAYQLTGTISQRLSLIPSNL